jgi:hypothetical protein
MKRGPLIAAGVVLAVCLSACDAGSHDRAASDPPSSVSTEPGSPTVGAQPETSEGCVDGTAVADGYQGFISAGPLADNSGYWRQPQGAKLWVASARDQPPTSAYIEARPLDAKAKPVKERRGPDRLAIVPNAALFYPGGFRIPQQGRWQITVRIGRDNGCFMVRVA